MPPKDELILAANVLSCREIHELPGDWNTEALRGLLADLATDTDGVAESDLLDLTLMAVGDLEPHEAGIAVMRAVFGDRMPSGVRASLATGLQEERPWEEISDLSFQSGIFTATVLLQKSMPKMYGIPNATMAEVALRAVPAKDAKLLVNLPSDQLLRALGPGLGPRSLANRLYEEGMGGGPFPEAEHIIWRRSERADPEDPTKMVFTVLGAHSFLADLKGAPAWQVEIDRDPE